MRIAIIVLAFLRITTANQPRWWIALKYPKSAFRRTGNSAGLQYDYADENHDSFIFQRGKLLNDPTSPLMKVLQSYMKAKVRGNHGWLAWNDSYNGKKYSQRGSQCKNKAHSKGFLFFNTYGGHLVTHSCPNYPKASLSLASNCKENGQHFLYLKLSRAGLVEFSKHLASLWAFKVEHGLRDDEARNLARIYPDLSAMAADGTNTLIGLTPKNEPVVSGRIQLAGRNSPSITVITKPCWKKESIYEIIQREEVTPSSILATTWIRAPRGKKEPSTGRVYNVMKIKGMYQSSPETVWKNSKEHSKYFVESRNDGEHAGIGDLNRVKTQHDRGGMFFIFKLRNLAESFRSRVMKYNTNTCIMVRQNSCTFRQVRRLKHRSVAALNRTRNLPTDTWNLSSCFACSCRLNVTCNRQHPCQCATSESCDHPSKFCDGSHTRRINSTTKLGYKMLARGRKNLCIQQFGASGARRPGKKVASCQRGTLCNRFGTDLSGKGGKKTSNMCIIASTRVDNKKKVTRKRYLCFTTNGVFKCKQNTYCDENGTTRNLACRTGCNNISKRQLCESDKSCFWDGGRCKEQRGCRGLDIRGCRKKKRSCIWKHKKCQPQVATDKKRRKKDKKKKIHDDVVFGKYPPRKTVNDISNRPYSSTNDDWVVRPITDAERRKFAQDVAMDSSSNKASSEGIELDEFPRQQSGELVENAETRFSRDEATYTEFGESPKMVMQRDQATLHVTFTDEERIEFAENVRMRSMRASLTPEENSYASPNSLFEVVELEEMRHDLEESCATLVREHPELERKIPIIEETYAELPDSSRSVVKFVNIEDPSDVASVTTADGSFLRVKKKLAYVSNRLRDMGEHGFHVVDALLAGKINFEDVAERAGGPLLNVAMFIGSVISLVHHGLPTGNGSLADSAMQVQLWCNIVGEGINVALDVAREGLLATRLSSTLTRMMGSLVESIGSKIAAAQVGLGLVIGGVNVVLDSIQLSHATTAFAIDLAITHLVFDVVGLGLAVASTGAFFLGALTVFSALGVVGFTVALIGMAVSFFMQFAQQMKEKFKPVQMVCDYFRQLKHGFVTPYGVARDNVTFMPDPRVVIEEVNFFTRRITLDSPRLKRTDLKESFFYVHHVEWVKATDDSSDAFDIRQRWKLSPHRRLPLCRQEHCGQVTVLPFVPRHTLTYTYIQSTKIALMVANPECAELQHLQGRDFYASVRDDGYAYAINNLRPLYFGPTNVTIVMDNVPRALVTPPFDKAINPRAWNQLQYRIVGHNDTLTTILLQQGARFFFLECGGMCDVARFALDATQLSDEDTRQLTHLGGKLQFGDTGVDYTNLTSRSQVLIQNKSGWFLLYVGTREIKVSEVTAHGSDTLKLLKHKIKDLVQSHHAVSRFIPIQGEVEHVAHVYFDTQEDMFVYTNSSTTPNDTQLLGVQSRQFGCFASVHECRVWCINVDTHKVLVEAQLFCSEGRSSITFAVEGFQFVADKVAIVDLKHKQSTARTGHSSALLLYRFLLQESNCQLSHIQESVSSSKPDGFVRVHTALNIFRNLASFSRSPPFPPIDARRPIMCTQHAPWVSYQQYVYNHHGEFRKPFSVYAWYKESTNTTLILDGRRHAHLSLANLTFMPLSHSGRPSASPQRSDEYRVLFYDAPRARVYRYEPAPRRDDSFLSVAYENIRSVFLHGPEWFGLTNDSRVVHFLPSYQQQIVGYTSDIFNLEESERHESITKEKYPFIVPFFRFHNGHISVTRSWYVPKHRVYVIVNKTFCHNGIVRLVGVVANATYAILLTMHGQVFITGVVRPRDVYVTNGTLHTDNPPEVNPWKPVQSMFWDYNETIVYAEWMGGGMTLKTRSGLLIYVRYPTDTYAEFTLAALIVQNCTRCHNNHEQCVHHAYSRANELGMRMHERTLFVPSTLECHHHHHADHVVQSRRGYLYVTNNNEFGMPKLFFPSHHGVPLGVNDAEKYMVFVDDTSTTVWNDNVRLNQTFISLKRYGDVLSAVSSSTVVSIPYVHGIKKIVVLLLNGATKVICPNAFKDVNEIFLDTSRMTVINRTIHVHLPWEVYGFTYKKVAGQLVMNNGFEKTVHWKRKRTTGSSSLSPQQVSFTFTSACPGRDYFMCGNKQCIPKFLTCDGVKHCADNSDESITLCPCPKTDQFQCANGQCIPGHYKCDGDFDCADSSDEFEEICPCPGIGQFQCADLQCIPDGYTCDGEYHCDDLSDEDEHLCHPVIALRGGNSSYGYVYVNGLPLCDDGWNDDAARVVCKMLGYTSGRSLSNSLLGQIGDEFFMDDFECNGDEMDIKDCTRVRDDDNCVGGEGAAIECFQRHSSPEQCAILYRNDKCPGFVREGNVVSLKKEWNDSIMAVEVFDTCTLTIYERVGFLRDRNLNVFTSGRYDYMHSVFDWTFVNCTCAHHEEAAIAAVESDKNISPFVRCDHNCPHKKDDPAFAACAVFYGDYYCPKFVARMLGGLYEGLDEQWGGNINWVEVFDHCTLTLYKDFWFGDESKVFPSGSYAQIQWGFDATSYTCSCVDRENHSRDESSQVESSQGGSDDDCIDTDNEPGCTCDGHTCTVSGKLQCIPRWWMCDGEEDCDDGDDESSCEQCMHQDCLSNSRQLSTHCDGFGSSQCRMLDTNSSTEYKYCYPCLSAFSCPLGHFLCGDRRRYIPLEWTCDGDIDCLDGSDERESCTDTCGTMSFPELDDVQVTFGKHHALPTRYNDKMNKLNVKAGYVVTVFEHDDFGGDHIGFSFGEHQMSAEWRWSISSYECRRSGCSLEYSWRYYGNNLVNGTSRALSWSECATKCELRDDCVFWTWVGLNLFYCYLKSSVYAKRPGSEADVSGRKCSSPQVVAERTSRITVPNNGACEQLGDQGITVSCATCNKYKDGKYGSDCVYVPSQHLCFADFWINLKKNANPTRWQAKAICECENSMGTHENSADCHCGDKTCDSSSGLFCLVAGVNSSCSTKATESSWFGEGCRANANPICEFHTLQGPMECLIECREDKDCMFYTWYRTNSLCVLMHGCPTGAWERTDDEVLSGTILKVANATNNRTSRCSSCSLEYDWDYFGNDLDKGHSEARSWGECATKCWRRDGCSFWTWKMPNQCYLKNSAGGRRRKKALVSGRKCSPPVIEEEICAGRANWNINVAVQLAIYFTHDAKGCEMKCRENKRCRFWKWHSATKMGYERKCILGRTKLTPQVEVGVTSGGPCQG